MLTAQAHFILPVIKAAAATSRLERMLPVMQDGIILIGKSDTDRQKVILIGKK